MISPVIICSRETETTRNSPVSRPMRTAAHFNSNYPMRVAVPQQHRELGCIRIRIGRQRAHVRFPNPGKPFDTCNPAGKLFQSAATPADAGALRRFLSVARLRFNFCRFLTGWSSSLRVQSLQEPTRGLAQSFHAFPFAVSHDRNLAWGSKHEVHRKSAPGAQSSE